MTRIPDTTKRGFRRSQWLVMRRCLAIIRRAQRGAASRDELIQAMLEEERLESYEEPGDKKALRLRLEKDLRRIRTNLMVDLYFDQQADGYVIKDTWMPLLDLPDEDLATIAWLEQTFDHDSPKHDEVHALLGRLRFYLAPERRRKIERQRTALRVDLGQRDEDEIQPAVWQELTKALTKLRRIEFRYRSPQQEDGEARRHVVDPYDCYFDTVRGHYYLQGWCHYTDGPLGRYDQRKYFYYRLGRIHDLHLLPNKLPPFPPSAPHYAAIYELSPQVARLGITHHPQIEIQEVERREDGSVVLRGETDNVFWAVRTLLHYGPNCKVLGGPEMRWEMRKIVRKMAEMYAKEG
jgi:predicted DNA-binding transcriptional regulator YafY